jgi:hypothetical protein
MLELVLAQSINSKQQFQTFGSKDLSLFLQDVQSYISAQNKETLLVYEVKEPPLWSSGQSSWLWIQRSRFDSRRYQIFWKVVGLERGPLSLVSTSEELLGRKSSGSGLEIWEYGRREPSRWPRGTLYPQELALTSPTNGGLSTGIVRSWTQATELFGF